MRAPNVTSTDLVAFVEAEGNLEHAPVVHEGQEDPGLEQVALDTFISSILKLIPDVKSGEKGFDKAKEALDRGLAEALPKFMGNLKASTLLDAKFWAYLNFRLYEVVSWRHPDGKMVNFGTNFTNFQESLLGRSYLRGKIGDTKELIGVPGSDLWRSHIIRVKAGNSKDVAQSILGIVRTKKLTAEVMRPFARRVNASRSNIVFELLGKAGSSRAIGLIWDEYEQSQTNQH